jgi:hypothetical protein
MLKPLSTLLGLLSIALFATPIHACTCIGITPEKALQRATHVFIARVTSVSEVTEKDSSHIQAKFQVTEIFKGDPTRLPYLRSGSSPYTSCTHEFKVDETRLYFTNDNGFVGSCDAVHLVIYTSSGSRESEFVRSLRSHLGAGHEP